MKLLARIYESMDEFVDEQLFPRLSVIHMYGLAVMLVLMVIGSFVFPMMDPDTLKPNEFFPSGLEIASFYFNVPVKLGLIHLIVYGLEYMHDSLSFERHIGQRLTTMWLQHFENARWGQHFHMQTETLLQVIDMLSRDHRNQTPRKYNVVIKTVLLLIALLMIVSNFITSTGYHSFYEQMLGALFTLFKVFGFDYLAVFQHVNETVGAAYDSKRNMITGIIVLSSVLCLVFVLGLYQELRDFVLHPTVLATILFLGCNLGKFLPTRIVQK